GSERFTRDDGCVIIHASDFRDRSLPPELPVTDARVEGSIVVLNLYDVAEEIKLTALAPLIGGTPLSPTFKHPAPEYVRFERPPVIESMPPLTLSTGERFESALQDSGYGDISLLLRFQFSGSWDDLEKRGGNWISSTIFDDLCRQTVRQQLKRVGAALVKPYPEWLSEDYYIIHLHSVAGVATAAALLQE